MESNSKTNPMSLANCLAIACRLCSCSSKGNGPEVSSHSRSGTNWICEGIVSSQELLDKCHSHWKDDDFCIKFRIFLPAQFSASVRSTLSSFWWTVAISAVLPWLSPHHYRPWPNFWSNIRPFHSPSRLWSSPRPFAAQPQRYSKVVVLPPRAPHFRSPGISEIARKLDVE